MPVRARLVRRSVLFALGLLALGSWPPVASAQEYFARNLGIYYQLAPYGQSYGARLTRNALPMSPLGQQGFETGDMIVALDQQGIGRPEDLDSHWAQTDVSFINIRTNQVELRSVWVPNWTALDRLSRATADDLRKGIVKYEQPFIDVSGNLLRWNFDLVVDMSYFMDWSDKDAFQGMPVDTQPVFSQYVVEALRITQQPQRAFFEPYFHRVERVIADELAHLATTLKPDEALIRKDEQRIRDIYSEAMQEYARRRGLQAQYSPTPRARGPCEVVLTNPDGFGIELTPLTKYRIARAYDRDPKYIRYRSGQQVMLLGYYMYRIVIDDQRTTAPAWIDIERDGPLTLR